MPHLSSARGGKSFSFIEWDAALENPVSQLADDGRGTRELDPAGPKKSKEEIEALSVDDSLSEIDRSLLLLTRQPVQRFSVLVAFSRIVAEEPGPAFSVLFPAIVKAAQESLAEPEFLRAAGAFLVEALATYEQTHGAVVQVHELAKSVMANPDEEMRQLFSELYLSTLSARLPNALLCQAIDSAKQGSNLTQPVAKRVWCARVLGSAAISLPPNSIATVVMDKAVSLCQDTDQEVRRKMAQEICRISVALDKCGDAALSMKEFSELCADEEPTVRAASLMGISTHLASFSAGCKAKWVVPAVLTALEDAAMADVLSQEFGHIIWFCREQFNAGQLELLANYYKSLACSPAEETRLRCVYNLPAVIRVLGSKIAGVANAFSRDASAAVRRKLAGCIHTLTEFIGANCASLLLPAFLTLLGDERTIYIAAVAELDKTFRYFYADNSGTKKIDLSDAIFLIMRRMREAVSHSNWRDVESVMVKMKTICEHFSAEQINEICSPLFLRVLHESPMIPLRHTAITLLVRQLRRLRRVEQRETMVKTLIGESSLGTSFKAKIQFLNLCSEVLHTCSSRMFRLYFALIFLNLSSDKVRCVRRKWLEVAPWALSAIRVPQLEAPLAKKLGEVIEELSKASNVPNFLLSGPYELQYDKTREAEEGFQTKPASEDSRRKENSAALNAVNNSQSAGNQSGSSAANNIGTSSASSALGASFSGKRTMVPDKKEKKPPLTVTRSVTSSSTAAAQVPPTSFNGVAPSSQSGSTVINIQASAVSTNLASASTQRRELSSKSMNKQILNSANLGKSGSSANSAQASPLNNSSIAAAESLNRRKNQVHKSGSDLSGLNGSQSNMSSNGSLNSTAVKGTEEHVGPFFSMPRRSNKDSSGLAPGQPRCLSPSSSKSSSMIPSVKRTKEKEKEKEKEKRGAGAAAPSK